jgi:dienelactone hydrolase
MSRALPFVLLAILGATAQAAVQSKKVTYKVGELRCEGFLAWDDAISGKRPGVLLVHEWWGLNDYARRRAEQLAGLGYVAFACDMYGEGKTTSHPQEAGQFAAAVRANVQEWQRRATVALETLKQQPQCDPERLAAIGYCFGGSTALQLVYTGADLDAVVTFHAALPTPTAEQARQIKAHVQVHHGADDSFIPEESIKKFRDTLTAAGVKHEFVSYPGARHSFTVPEADKVGIDGLRYNKQADEQSWEAMVKLFRERLGKA